MTSVELQEIANLRDQLAAMTAERDEWQRRARVAQDAQIARGDVFSDTNPEAQYVKDCENTCPTCGGSGHKDDAAGYVAERDALVGAERMRLYQIWVRRDLTHDDFHTEPTPALDHIRAQAKAEGMREAARIAENTGTCLMQSGHFFSEQVRDAILAAAQKEAGK